MTPEIREFLLDLRRQYLTFVSSIEKLLGMSRTCPHCSKKL